MSDFKKELEVVLPGSKKIVTEQELVPYLREAVPAAFGTTDWDKVRKLYKERKDGELPLRINWKCPVVPLWDALGKAAKVLEDMDSGLARSLGFWQFSDSLSVVDSEDLENEAFRFLMADQDVVHWVDVLSIKNALFVMQNSQDMDEAVSRLEDPDLLRDKDLGLSALFIDWGWNITLEFPNIC